MQGGGEGAQAGAVPAGTRGIPGTGNPSDTDHDPRVVFSNVSSSTPVVPKMLVTETAIIRVLLSLCCSRN